MATCHHCKQQCKAVQLDEETFTQIDMCGVESLQEVDQAVYEGISLCEDCYYKEKGL